MSRGMKNLAFGFLLAGELSVNVFQPLFGAGSDRNRRQDREYPRHAFNIRPVNYHDKIKYEHCLGEEIRK